MNFLNPFKKKVLEKYPQAYSYRQFSMFGKPHRVLIISLGEHGHELNEKPEVLGTGWCNIIAWKNAYENINNPDFINYKTN